MKFLTVQLLTKHITERLQENQKEIDKLELKQDMLREELAKIETKKFMDGHFKLK